MYRKRDQKQVSVDECTAPFEGKLPAGNRWVKLSQVIPRDRIEDRYAAKFGACGNVAIPLRLTLGALIIKEKGGFSGGETVENISENNRKEDQLGEQLTFEDKGPFTGGK